MAQPFNIDALEAEVVVLDELRHDELQAQYKALTGDALPEAIDRDLLVLAVSYELQRKAHRSNGRGGMALNHKTVEIKR